jgi:hypothetical protein
MDYSPHLRNELLLVSESGHLLDDPRSLIRDVAKGALVRLRRGVFIPTSAWNQASPRHRHVLRIRAAIAATNRPVAVAGISAAALWGMPVASSWPDEVTLLDEWRGGGRSEPGVRRTSAGFRSAEIVTIDGIRVTSLPRTAIDVARRSSFADGVGSLDWALWQKNKNAVTKLALLDDLRQLDSRSGIRHVERSIEFSTHLSDSFGESRCRVVIHFLGFAAPELQHEFQDTQGAMYPDFTWLRQRKAAEFDGKMKYTRNEYNDGDPAEKVWQEKKREDRLRRMNLQTTRLLTSDVENPERLASLLIDLGVERQAPWTEKLSHGGNYNSAHRALSLSAAAG